MQIISYKVLIIIETNEFDQKPPVLILKFLHDREYSDKSERGVKFPVNTYIGLENQAVLEWESEKDGADKLKQRLYGKLNRIRKLEKKPTTVFLMISPKEKTLFFVSRFKEKKSHLQ
ncbi:hypothetical protein [Enterobacter cloacae]|uniref:hypothetical protein n=1 Tax=Enterobacter cloacae TaxID=550 RepID=UPI0006676F23|nr:hypothetical protein [Enterobacter cloacae]